MKKILSYGSLNYDLVYHVPHFVMPGETLAATETGRFPGGKGLNQSIALARAGAGVFHGGKTGPDGESLVQLLRESGADPRYTRTDGTATGTAVIQVAPSGENCILLSHGANYEQTREDFERALTDFAEGDLLLLQNEISGLPLLIKLAAQKGMAVALNPSPIDPALLAMDLGAVSFLILNEIEGRAMTGEEKPEAICQALLGRYPDLKIVLTLGTNGSLYADRDTRLRQGIFETKAVDTTAAGVTFSGYFLALTAEGRQAAEALRTASKASALAVSRRGAAVSIPKRCEVEAANLRELPFFEP